MAQYELEYGAGNLTMEIPAERVVGIVEPAGVDEVPDVDASVRAAIAAPIDSPPLRDLLAGKQTALILTVDHTRPSPAPLLRPILDECDRAGVTATICVATGRHRLMTGAEIERHFPADIRKRAELVQHDAFDDASVRDLGVTSRGTRALVNSIVFEHDAVLGAGILEPSYLCGFSGGRKLICPGVAHHSTVDSNHFLLTDPDARIGRLHGNPVSEDAIEVARMAPYHFIVYAVSGPCDETVEAIAGDPFVAHETACERAAELYRVERIEAGIVIASAGGYPYDCDLVQGKKAIVPAAAMVRSGGAIILLAECAEGLGAEATFLEWLRTMTPAEVVASVRRREQFSLGSHGANILAAPIVERDATVIVVTRPEICRDLDGAYLAAVETFAEAWAIAEAATGGDADVAIVRKARRLIVN